MQHSFISGLPTSCFYMGCLLGGLTSAMLADSSLSRKNLLMFSCLVMSVAAFATTISINICMYLPLRPVSGFGCASIETCTIVLATKMVAERWRGFIGMMGLFVGTLGYYPFRPTLTYLGPASWRYLCLTTSLPGMLYLYLAVMFNGIRIIPLYFAPYFMIDRLTRKGTLLGFTVPSGALSIGCALVGSGLKWRNRVGASVFHLHVHFLQLAHDLHNRAIPHTCEELCHFDEASNSTRSPIRPNIDFSWDEHSFSDFTSVWTGSISVRDGI